MSTFSGCPIGSPVVIRLVHTPLYISATAGFTLAFFFAASGRYLGMNHNMLHGTTWDATLAISLSHSSVGRNGFSSCTSFLGRRK